VKPTGHARNNRTEATLAALKLFNIQSARMRKLEQRGGADTALTGFILRIPQRAETARG